MICFASFFVACRANGTNAGKGYDMVWTGFNNYHPAMAVDPSFNQYLVEEISRMAGTSRVAGTSREAEASPEMVTRVTFPGAGHGISYLADEERYKKITGDFLKKIFA